VVVDYHGEHVGGRAVRAEDDEIVEVLVREADIALVLLDLTLPGISGEELLAQVRSQRPAIKFLVMSGWDDLKQRAALMGAEAFARKFVADKFGAATTHWAKLEERISRGVGNPCPLLLIGLPESVLADAIPRPDPEPDLFG